MSAERRALWIGTYTPGSDPGGAGEGIHLVWLDPATGALTGGGVAARTDGPSFLARHPGGHLLYAVNERAEGGLTGFAVGADGALRELGTVPTGGSSPCHLAVHPAGRHVIVANYADGGVAVHPIAENGAPRVACALLTHTGGGPDAARQAGPHAHHVSVAPGGRHLFVCDLGTDELRRHPLDAAPTDSRIVGPGGGTPVAARLPAGTGPRHLAAHPTGHLYISGELDSRVHVLRWDGAAATAVPLVAVPATTTPDAAAGPNHPAELALSPDATRLYVANRGADTIAAFEVGPDGADLRPIAEVATGGARPRHFALVDGAFLVVANQGSGDLTVLRLDPATGIPQATGHRLELPDPVCVLPV
ncbi:6-phosphogluconolactonase (cycloisomerase 2 family) [Nocardiopsis mwathae]|uniref:6-phosphogluconolactonase (Cycloisomerase 2 family) n=1 Tax=Nocardiopsis mwathae TaxID=1472723 RepID=A0A7W9YFK9_9ACTN|nr:lactonase family protein [Nocardiopsis mwathae]MBB6170566.1 6-phosphogluconolactonase (cycloisomerase 2 family) [Nocardiopsis mwathae]